MLHDEADPAEDDEPHHRQIDDPVPTIRHQVVRKEGVAAVVEGRTALYSAWKKAVPGGKSCKKRMNKTNVPTASLMKVSRKTPLTITMKSRRGVWRNVDWTISRPLKETPRPIRPKRTTEKVMIPKPPIWEICH